MEDLSKALREVSTLSLNKLFLAWRGKVLYAIVILSVLFILFYFIISWYETLATLIQKVPYSISI